MWTHICFGSKIYYRDVLCLVFRIIILGRHSHSHTHACTYKYLILYKQKSNNFHSSCCAAATVTTALVNASGIATESNRRQKQKRTPTNRNEYTEIMPFSIGIMNLNGGIMLNGIKMLPMTTITEYHGFILVFDDYSRFFFSFTFYMPSKLICSNLRCNFEFSRTKSMPINTYEMQ